MEPVSYTHLKAWEAAKAFLDSHRTEKGTLTAEDDAAYTKMEQEITDLGKEIARLERQEAFEHELAQPVNKPLTGRPSMGGTGKEKSGRASDEYKSNFWNAMRSKAPLPDVVNACLLYTSLHPALPRTEPDGKDGADSKPQTAAEREPQICNENLAPPPGLYRRRICNSKGHPDPPPCRGHGFPPRQSRLKGTQG